MARRKRKPKPGGGQQPNPPLNAPNYPVEPRDLAALLSYGPAYLPYTPAWTDSRIEQVRAFRRWVYVAIDAVASKFADKTPNLSYVKVGAGSAAEQLARKRASGQRQKALAPLQSHQWLDPVEHNHPLCKLLADPNDPDVAYDLWYETVMFLLLTGIAYWWAPLGPGGVPEALWVLPSHWVWPIVGKERLLEGYELRPVEGNYLRQVLPAEEVITFRRKNPVSKIDGLSPLTAIAQWADVSESIDRARTHSYRNGLMQTVAVQFDGQLNDPTEEMLRRIEAKILARYAGENRANRPMFLPPGVKVTPLSLKPNEMVFGETAQETRDNILAGFKVPPLIAGLAQGATRRDITAAQILFCTQCLNPLASYVGQVISEKLCRWYKGVSPVRAWWEAFRPDDPYYLEDTIKTDLLCGAVTTNEVRMLRGREPIPEPWADRPILPVNMQPMALPGGGGHADPGGPGAPQPTNLPDQPLLNPEDT